MLEPKEEYSLILGDCITEMAMMTKRSVDFSVFSPPFPQVYTYSSLPADLGNSEDLEGDTRLHFSFFMRTLLPVMKPGRNVAVHCTEIPMMKKSGRVGMFDFPGLLRRLAIRAGFTYWYTWQIRRNPQAQAIKTKSRQLQFSGLEADRAMSRGAMADYIILLKAPGENAVPVDSKGEVSRNEWIDWAECCWTGIKETDTLNWRGTKSENDTKHICPLQIGVIDRLVRMYTNPGEIVFSPFAGIGSEGYVALKHERRFYGCELKPEYHELAVQNLEMAIRERESAKQQSLFAAIPDSVEDSAELVE